MQWVGTSISQHQRAWLDFTTALKIQKIIRRWRPFFEKESQKLKMCSSKVFVSARCRRQRHHGNQDQDRTRSRRSSEPKWIDDLKMWRICGCLQQIKKFHQTFLCIVGSFLLAKRFFKTVSSANKDSTKFWWISCWTSCCCWEIWKRETLNCEISSLKLFTLSIKSPRW